MNYKYNYRLYNVILRGGGTGGIRGGRTPPRIGDLFSKIFKNSQKKIFL